MPANPLPCAYAKQIQYPNHPNWEVSLPSRPQLFTGGIAPVMIFFDSNVLWAYYLDGNLAWSFETTRANVLNGWTTHKNDLYIMLGDVLCQFTPSTWPVHMTEQPRPANAVRFGTDGLSAWTNDGDASGFDAMLAQNPTVQVSPPVYDASTDRVHVVTSDGTLYSFRVDLDATLGNYEIKKTGLAPDRGPDAQDDFLGGYTQWYSPADGSWTINYRIFLEPQPDGTRRVCWVSGGKVAVAATGQRETPQGGLDAWVWKCVNANTDQPFHRFCDDHMEAGIFPAVSRVPQQDGQAALVVYQFPFYADILRRTLVPASSRQLLCSFLTPACFPTFNTSDPPFGLASYPPDGIQSERTGVVTLANCAGVPSGQAITSVAEHPFVNEENGELFIYGIWHAGQSYYFAKHGLPSDPSNGWTKRWWGALKATIIDYGVSNWGADPAEFSKYGAPPVAVDFPSVESYLNDPPNPNPVLPTSYLFDAVEHDWLGGFLQLAAIWWPLWSSAYGPFGWMPFPFDIAPARDLLPLGDRPINRRGR